MPRPANGTIFEKGNGRWWGRFTTAQGRRAVELVTCKSAGDAEARRQFIAAQLGRLREAGCEQFADKLLELAARARPDHLDRVVRGVDAIVAGEYEEPVAADLPDTGPTFRDFATQWTNGELTKRFPDHVRTKKTAEHDVYRLDAHIYPVVGDIPIARFRTEDAELVMRSLPPELAAGSRRQVAQLLHRVLKLAAYPARLIERSPLPKGFLPKPSAKKAQQWLYPEEDLRLLRCVDVPLRHRVLYGFLAREGMRRSEAMRLCWSDIDMTRGTVTLDENKTDDPRAWVLDPGVVTALERWRKLACPRAKASDEVFASSDEGMDENHLATTFRSHLNRAGSMRQVLFHRTKARNPIRLHDLRATFVTLSLALGRTETWVCDRTGHRSSQMVNGYRRAARTAEELQLGPLTPLHEAIPELGENVPESSPDVPTGSDEPHSEPEVPEMTPVECVCGGASAFRFQRRKAWRFDPSLAHSSETDGERHRGPGRGWPGWVMSTVRISRPPTSERACGRPGRGQGHDKEVERDRREPIGTLMSQDASDWHRRRAGARARISA
jgi:integrase